MVERARQMARQALETLYEGTCTVWEYHAQRDAQSGETSFVETEVLRGIPCRLSGKTNTIQSLSNPETSVGVAELNQMLKLILSPEYAIQPGSKIEVTQNGHTYLLANSGAPVVFATHQELMLQRFERWV